MAHRIVKQPDNQYAIFSTMVDDFVLINATLQQVKDYELGWNLESLKNNIEFNINNSLNKYNYEDCIKERNYQHGDENNILPVDFESEAIEGKDVSPIVFLNDIVIKDYTTEEVKEQLKALTLYLKKELSLSQYPSHIYDEMTEEYIKNIL